MEIYFEKYNGLGNDFVILDHDLDESLITKICDRRFGIGSDGLIILSKKNDRYFMKFYNQDGTVASMCGNGIRCYTHYLYNKNLINKNENILIDTLAGIKKVKIINLDPFEVKVKMGEASDVNLNQVIEIDGKEYIYHYVNTGVMHIVIYVNKNDLNEEFVNEIGKKIQSRKDIFPDSVNVNFVYINDAENIEAITYERGVGLTLACGTGACACAYISKILGYCDSYINVKLLGGDLRITFDNNNIYMTGKSEFVFKGSINV